MADGVQALGVETRPLPSARLPRGKARAHSRFVRVLRWLLPAIMVGVLALLAGLVAAHAIRRQAAAHKDVATPIRMTNPLFFGRDAQGRPFTLGARQAARDERQFQTVLLKFPSMTFDVGGPHPSTITADSGIYREDTHMLLLRGNVKANDTKASKFATDEALVDTRTGLVSGPASLAGQTSVGDVKSNSFDVFDKGDRVVFKGGVHTRLSSSH